MCPGTNQMCLKSIPIFFCHLYLFLNSFLFIIHSGIYNFFLTVQHMDISKTNEGASLLSTKLARLCLNDLSFTKSYTEIPLKCTGHGIQKSTDSASSQYSLVEYNELIGARLVSIKSWPLQAEENAHHIIGLFQETSRSNFNASLNADANAAPIKQAVCIFPMQQIQSTIKQNLNRCYNNYNDEPIMRGLSFIKPDQRCSSKANARRVFRQQQHQDSSIGDDFCSTADNGMLNNRCFNAELAI